MNTVPNTYMLLEKRRIRKETCQCKQRIFKNTEKTIHCITERGFTMRLINQKSFLYPVDVPYDRVWLEITDNEINARDGIQSVKLGKYSSQENASQ